MKFKQSLTITREEELLQFEERWDLAFVNNDYELISTFMSDDWVIVGTSGGITDKKTFLEWIKSGDVQHTRMDSDETRVKVYGNTGVVISKGTSAGHYKGVPFELYEWAMSIFLHDGKNWICVATMLTDARPEKWL